MIAIVCGGRSYPHKARVHQILNAAVDKLGLSTIIEGEAGHDADEINPLTGDKRVLDGADRLAREWARERKDINIIALPVDWASVPATQRRALGPARNAMQFTILLRAEEPKAVIAFQGNSGTANMVRIAENHNRSRGAEQVRIIKVDWE